MYHETQMHRRQWTCASCSNQKFASKNDMRSHLLAMHSGDFPESQLAIMVDICERPMDDDENVDCPICLATLALSALRVHLATHLEELALFVLPCHMEDRSQDAGSDRAEGAAGQDFASDASSSEDGLPALDFEKSLPDALHSQDPEMFSTLLQSQLESEGKWEDWVSQNLQIETQDDGESSEAIAPLTEGLDYSFQPPTVHSEKLEIEMSPVEHVNNFQYILPLQFTEGTPEAEDWLQDTKSRYLKVLVDQENGVRLEQAMADDDALRKEQDIRLSPDQETDLNEKREANLKKLAETRRKIDDFHAQQTALERPFYDEATTSRYFNVQDEARRLQRTIEELSALIIDRPRPKNAITLGGVLNQLLSSVRGVRAVPQNPRFWFTLKKTCDQLELCKECMQTIILIAKDSILKPDSIHEEGNSIWIPEVRIGSAETLQKSSEILRGATIKIAEEYLPLLEKFSSKIRYPPSPA
jgi:hypothetical protein